MGRKGLFLRFVTSRRVLQHGAATMMSTCNDHISFFPQLKSLKSTFYHLLLPPLDNDRRGHLMGIGVEREHGKGETSHTMLHTHSYAHPYILHPPSTSAITTTYALIIIIIIIIIIFFFFFFNYRVLQNPRLVAFVHHTLHDTDDTRRYIQTHLDTHTWPKR
ncbi:hypothetical protein BKA80DRAFT_128483 [Phyllosticta citrichinensis]